MFDSFNPDRTHAEASAREEKILLVPATANNPLPRLAYTMQETADILGVSYITVHRLLKRGLLKSSTALRHKLIPASEIERFLKSTLE
jgi:excisionase family DNA binding protein